MDELITSFKAQMYEKARSPFLTAFMVSWVSWNLKTIIILIGSAGVETKLKLLEGLYTNLEDYVWHWILYPLLSASAFIFLYPIIALVAFSYWNFLNNLIKKIQVSQDDKVPATSEDARKLRRLISEVSIEKQKIIDDLVDKNSELMQKDESTNNLIAQLESEKRDLSRALEGKDVLISNLEQQNIELKGVNDELISQVENMNASLKKATNNENLNIAKELQFDTSVKEPDENTSSLLDLLAKIQNRHKINVDQLRLLILLIITNGRETPAGVKRALQLEDIKYNALISTMERKKLIDNFPSNNSVTLTRQMEDELFETGILSIPEYKKILNMLIFQ